MRRQPHHIVVSMLPDYLEERIRIPKIQRDAKVWTLEHKQNLIDSLYNDFDIPKVYLREEYTDQRYVIWWVVDGQQRISTIAEFLRDEFPLGDASTMPGYLHGLKCSDLSPDDQRMILSRSLDAIIVQCDDDEEEDMFLRLNMSTPLSAAEKRNVIRGNFRDTVAELAGHEFFKNKACFSGRRLAYHTICAQMVALFLAGGPTDTRGKWLNKLYEDYRDKFTNQKEVEGTIKRILGQMDRIFPAKESFLRKANFVSIFLFLFELTLRLDLSTGNDERLRGFFDGFERRLESNTQIPEDDSRYEIDLERYQMACINGADSEASIRTRHEVLLKNYSLQIE